MKKRFGHLAVLIGALALAGGACQLSDLATGLTGRRPPERESEPVSQPEAESALPLAEIVNDEGGPVTLSGQVAYTNPFFTAGVAEPVVILEDQAGFVSRDRDFVFPLESQVLGQITSDFFTSPFTYSLNLPLIPQGTLRDVDQDGEQDPGVMVYAVAYWTNTWGDPFLERRDQHGGGWSTHYVSTRVSDDRDRFMEVIGGKYVIYAPEEGQGFPAGFGTDGLLFTEDDPIVEVPVGWTVVDLDSDPFTFDRSREPVLDLLEPEQSALDDFSDMPYSRAFDAMLEKMSQEYAFTEYKSIDWHTLGERFRPRFESADQSGDTHGYYLALRDFLWSIPDGHVSMDTSVLIDDFAMETAGGLGMALQELDDDRVLVSYLVDGGPADEAGIQFGAEILELNSQPIQEALAENVPWSSPFSTEHSKRLQQLRYAVRFPLGTEVEVTYENPGGNPQTAALPVVAESESFAVSSLYAGLSGLELPVEFDLLEGRFGYVQITSFFDNELLTIQLWERMMRELNEEGIPGLVIDLRQNQGGSGYLARQMAAYFFDQEVVTGNTGYYDDSIDDFYFDEGDQHSMFPPPQELRYDGPVVAIVGPACASACEFFSYAMTLQDRAVIVGRYPTAGLGGSVEDFVMPEDITVRFTIGRAVDADGQIHIEGTGVVPDERIPLTEEAFFAIYREGTDVELQAALEVLAGR